MELFPRTVQAPPILRVRINQPPARPDYDYSKESLEQVAQRLLNKHRANIINFSLAQRAMARRSGLPIYKSHRNYPGVFVMYTLQQGTEQLDVTLYPVPPIKKPEEDLCLVVFHDQNKVSAFFMKQLEFQEDKPPTKLKLEVTRELRSSWSEDLLKAAQYKFDENDGGVAMSPIKIENNRVTRSETHCFVSVKDKFNTFFDTSTLARRTPHINGRQKIYFCPNDKFEFAENGLAYVGGYGGGGAPAAVSSEGVYYYRPSFFGEWALWLGSADYAENLPENSPVTDAIADAQKTTWDISGTAQFLTVAPHIFNTSGATPGAAGGITYLADTTWAVQLSETFSITPIWDSLGAEFIPGPVYLNSATAISGFARWADDSMTYTVNFSSYSETLGEGSPGSAINPDVSFTAPVTLFSQLDGVDMLEVVLQPVEINYQWLETYIPSTTYSNAVASVTFLGYTFTRNYTSPGSTFTGTQSSTYPPITGSYPSGSDIRMSQAWFVTFPPSLGVDESTYFFAHDGSLLTPYGEFEFTPSGPNARHNLNMEGVYTPWFHLSNGKTYLQAFQVGEERHIFCKTTEITDMLATACETEINNIQGCLIDFPLARVKELV